jgi:uncharacterized protein YndB with AHSA1/START domain
LIVALIDQRILIDAPPQMIWEYISDPDAARRDRDAAALHPGKGRQGRHRRDHRLG